MIKSTIFLQKHKYYEKLYTQKQFIKKRLTKNVSSAIYNNIAGCTITQDKPKLSLYTLSPPAHTLPAHTITARPHPLSPPHLPDRTPCPPAPLSLPTAVPTSPPPTRTTTPPTIFNI